MLYRKIESIEDWRKLTSERILSGWYHDADLTQPATEAEADAAGEDIYTDFGWNVEPRQYPVLAHIETR